MKYIAILLLVLLILAGCSSEEIIISDYENNNLTLNSQSNITTTEVNDEYTSECTNNNDCTQTCANCIGTYVCTPSTAKTPNQRCVECIFDSSCIKGYVCENNICVEEKKDIAFESLEINQIIITNNLNEATETEILLAEDEVFGGSGEIVCDFSLKLDKGLNNITLPCNLKENTAYHLEIFAYPSTGGIKGLVQTVST